MNARKIFLAEDGRVVVVSEAGLVGLMIRGLVEGVGNMGNKGPTVYNKAATDKLIAELVAARDENYRMAVINHGNYLGAVAQRDALLELVKKELPSADLLKPSGLRFQTGEVKNKLRIFFEEAFDKELRRIGGIFGVNPKYHRKD